jgi:hypothetical protein
VPARRVGARPPRASAEGQGLALRAHEGNLVVANEELSAGLLERNPIGAVSTFPVEEQLKLMLQGVVALDGNRVVLPVDQRDFEVQRSRRPLPADACDQCFALADHYSPAEAPRARTRAHSKAGRVASLALHSEPGPKSA